MNIFFLDRDPAKAARYHCDKHVVKLILESAQLLSTAHRVLDGDNNHQLNNDSMNITLYKATHINHPSAKWVRSGIMEYRWTFDLFFFLLVEYNLRWNKKHKCNSMINSLMDAPQNIPTNDFNLTDPPLVMPEDCMAACPVYSYRKYYMTHKKDIAQWKYSPRPDWFELHTDENS